MGFDEEPEELHGECAAEIATLEAKLEDLHSGGYPAWAYPNGTCSCRRSPCICDDPMPEVNEMFAALEEERRDNLEAFKPIESWYNNEGAAVVPTFAKMLEFAVADMQRDRKEIRKQCAENRNLEARWNAGFAEFLNKIGVDGSTVDLVTALNSIDEMRAELVEQLKRTNLTVTYKLDAEPVMEMIREATAELEARSELETDIAMLRARVAELEAQLHEVAGSRRAAWEPIHRPGPFSVGEDVVVRPKIGEGAYIPARGLRLGMTGGDVRRLRDWLNMLIEWWEAQP